MHIQAIQALLSISACIAHLKGTHKELQRQPFFDTVSPGSNFLTVWGDWISVDDGSSGQPELRLALEHSRQRLSNFIVTNKRIRGKDSQGEPLWHLLCNCLFWGKNNVVRNLTLFYKRNDIIWPDLTNHVTTGCKYSSGTPFFPHFSKAHLS